MNALEKHPATVAQLAPGEEAARSVEAVLWLCSMALDRLNDKMIFGEPVTPEMAEMAAQIARAIDDTLAPIAKAREALTNSVDHLVGRIRP